ncbi:MAG: sigma-70 family RNA polymerase sigma factor [Bacteroidales bacterium]
MVAILLSSKRVNQSDQALIKLYREKHDKALVGELFNRYSGFVLAICIKYLKDKSEAEEMTLVIFESLFKKLKNHKVEYFKTWLYSVSKNQCLEYLRKDNTRIKHEEQFQNTRPDFMESDVSLHQNNDDENDKEKQNRALMEALKTLSDEQRQCLELFYLEGNTYADIVKQTGYSLKKVKSHLQNGKRNLKIKLEKKNA